MSDSVSPSTLDQQISNQVCDKTNLIPQTNEDIESSNRFNDPIATIHPSKLARQQQHKEPQHHHQQQEEEVSEYDDSSSSSSKLSTLRQNDLADRPPPDLDLEKLLAPHPSQLTVHDASECPKAVASTYTPPVGKHLMAGGKLAQEKRGQAIRHGPPSARLQQFGGAHGANRVPESRQ